MPVALRHYGIRRAGGVFFNIRLTLQTFSVKISYVQCLREPGLLFRVAGSDSRIAVHSLILRISLISVIESGYTDVNGLKDKLIFQSL